MSRLAASTTFGRLTALLSLASVWVLEDIHWGWHFNYSDHTVSAVFASTFWLAMLVFSALVAWRLLHHDFSPSLISWLRLVQLPMIAFNLIFLRAYFEDDSYVPLKGLGALLLGITVLSWSCQQILLVDRPGSAVMAADARTPQAELNPTLTAR